MNVYFVAKLVGEEWVAGFKIAAAQVPAVRGDLARNVQTHADAIGAAAEQGVSVLIFPELSLTGYEPDLAAELAITGTDHRLAPVAALARQHRMAVVVGAPLRTTSSKPALGAIVFDGDHAPRTSTKMHLGGTEPNYFSSGADPLSISIEGQKIGLAICADTSKPTHPQTYADDGCSIYAAGVFLNAEWYPADPPRFAAYSVRFQMLVVMANHAASMGTLTSVGKSAVWSPDGTLLAEAAGTENCLVVANYEHEKWSGKLTLVA